jgi:hypothetical protein
MEIKYIRTNLQRYGYLVNETLKKNIKIKTIRPSTPTQNYLNPTWVDETLKKGMKINLKKSK